MKKKLIILITVIVIGIATGLVFGLNSIGGL